MLKRWWQKFLLYAKLPEMRLFWFFLPFLIALLAINVFYLTGFWIFVSSGIFLILTVMVLINNLRLARMNLEIKIERNELKSIISNLQDGIIAYDSNFKILVFNKAAEEIFNLSSQEIIGEYFTLERAQESRFKLLAQVIFPSLAPLIVRRSEPGIYPQITDFSFEEPKLELRIASDKIIDPNGRLLGFVKIVHDRTREIGLLRSKTEFIAVASHQLRTPATAINWALESLTKQSLAEEQKDLIETALSAAGKLLKTINDLLDVSKIEEGKFGYQFENVNIIEFLEDILKQSEFLSKQYGVNVYFQKPAETAIIISLDAQKLAIAFSNLLDNAIKYNVKNGQVIVEVKRLQDKPYIQISVKDTGVGIPADQVDKLFTKFFRAENVVKFVSEGSGLGLYIAKNIIKRHGGEIWAESEINRGSTFYFTLPTDPKLVPAKEIIYGEE